jgi:hypothetical protein
VRVTVIVLPEFTVALETVTTEFAGENAPPVTVIVGRVVVTATVFTVAFTVVAVPAAAPVKVEV